jgi:pilus assembly protein Flp/PilA
MALIIDVRPASQAGDQCMSNLIARFAKAQSGATAIEYGLIVALIAVVIIGAVTMLGTSLSTTYNTVTNNL